jgi:Peptidase M10 serralysin C terminal
LSVAGSNTTLVDIISDFASGSDEIDLAALGALTPCVEFDKHFRAAAYHRLDL